MQYGLQWMCDWGAPYSPPGYIYTDAVGHAVRNGRGRLAAIDYGPERQLADGDGGGDYEQPVGVSVPFVRDGQGRITQITDTLGRQLPLRLRRQRKLGDG